MGEGKIWFKKSPASENGKQKRGEDIPTAANTHQDAFGIREGSQGSHGGGEHAGLFSTFRDMNMPPLFA